MYVAVDILMKNIYCFDTDKYALLIFCVPNLFNFTFIAYHVFLLLRSFFILRCSITFRFMA